MANILRFQIRGLIEMKQQVNTGITSDNNSFISVSQHAQLHHPFIQGTLVIIMICVLPCCFNRYHKYLILISNHNLMHTLFMIFFFQHANEDVERMLLGNKCDMEDKRVVPKAKGEQVRRYILLTRQLFIIPV